MFMNFRERSTLQRVHSHIHFQEFIKLTELTDRFLKFRLLLDFIVFSTQV